MTRQRLAGRIARLESAPGYWIPRLPDCPETTALYESAARCRKRWAAARAVLAMILEPRHPERAASLRLGEIDSETAFAGVPDDPEEWRGWRNAAVQALARMTAQ